MKILMMMSLTFTFSNYPVCWFLRLFTPVFPSLNNQTGPILIAVFITEMVILFKHVIIIIIIIIISSNAQHTYSSTWEEAFIVNQAFFLLQIELNPVMEANHFCPVSWFTHKNMFKARWVQFPKKSNQFEAFKWTNKANQNQLFKCCKHQKGNLWVFILHYL